MLKRIPEHIFWPGMVVAILTMSVVANMWLLWNASSDGGAQIIDDYYNKASSWDETAAVKAKSAERGWSVVLKTDALGEGQRLFRFQLADAEQRALEGLSATVTLKNPMKVDDISTGELNEAEPGVYLAVLPVSRHGLWDVELRVGSGEPVFVWDKRIEVRE